MSTASPDFTPTLPPAPLGDDTLRQRVQSALDQKTKPPGSLADLRRFAGGPRVK
jgi:nicotinate-nucleotide--dimethylbenzimidazole phosphoribosyltransferase